jgi:hypothetical protein
MQVKAIQMDVYELVFIYLGLPDKALFLAII